LPFVLIAGLGKAGMGPRWRDWHAGR